MNLRDFPRPKNDNGIGLHFRLDLRESPERPLITEGVEWLLSINAKWTLIAGGDWSQLAKAARPVWDAGIMPVCRLVTKIDRPFIDWAEGVKTLHDLGIPAYIQIFNEPGDPREWRDEQPRIDQFGEKWADAAARVFAAGGLPGMGGILALEEWQAAFNAVKAAGNMELWDKAWFCVHNYGSNHPPNYPYDDVNQKGIPVTPAEYEKYRFSIPFDELNLKRAQDKNPGDTVLEDDTTVLRVLLFKKWMEDSLGFCLPMIGGEGGWQWQTEEDLRYPKLPDEFHAGYTREMFEWFRTGKLSDGTPLPDELFCCTAWIQADGQADSWWFGPLGTKQGTIDAVASIPTFVRKFSWDAAGPPEPQPIVIPQPPVAETPVVEPEPIVEPPISVPPTDETPVLEPPPVVEPPPTVEPPVTEPDPGVPPAPETPPVAGFTYTVQQGETLWGIAKKFGTSIDALIQANDITDRNKIRAGQKLIIPR